MLCAKTKGGMKIKEEKTYYPTNDYLFKRLFGHRGNEKITQELIETILEEEFEVIEVHSDEVTEKDLASDKIGVLDVFVKQKDGMQLNLEMQMVEYEYVLTRVVFYWAKKYIESIQIGDDYGELKPTKVILIANFEIKKLESLKEIANSFKIIDVKTGKVILTNDLEIVIIELPKMRKYKIENKNLESWLKFIKNPYSLGDKEMEKSVGLKRAKEEYDKIMADEHEKTMIKLRESYILETNTIKKENYRKGKEEGMAQGREQRKKRNSQENAKNENESKKYSSSNRINRERNNRAKIVSNFLGKF